jgi:hypothetical protein
LLSVGVPVLIKLMVEPVCRQSLHMQNLACIDLAMGQPALSQKPFQAPMIGTSRLKHNPLYFRYAEPVDQLGPSNGPAIGNPPPAVGGNPCCQRSIITD